MRKRSRLSPLPAFTNPSVYGFSVDILIIHFLICQSRHTSYHTNGSTIQVLDHYPSIQHLVTKLPVQAVSISCYQNTTKPGIFRQRLNISHQCRAESIMLIFCIDHHITKIVSCRIITDHPAKADQFFIILQIYSIA